MMIVSFLGFLCLEDIAVEVETTIGVVREKDRGNHRGKVRCWKSAV
jgi:hypothetical protein